MNPFEIALVVIGIAAVTVWGLVQRRRDQSPEVREARAEAVRIERERLARKWAAAAPPAQPAEPSSWANLVDTAWDGRLCDQDLLYLEAVLRAEGIAADFEPHRPGQHVIGFMGPQYPLRLVVDAARLDEARAIRIELLGEEWENWQLRLANPYVDVPSRREALILAAVAVRVAHDSRERRWFRALAWAYIAWTLLGYALLLVSQLAIKSDFMLF